MFPLKILPQVVFGAMLFASLPAVAQQANTEYKITKIEPNFIDSPRYSGPTYNKRGFKPKSWLEVEVTFDWQPRAKEPKYTDELTFNYYILLKNESKQAPMGTLLTGSVTHVSIPQERDMHSVVYVSPRTLERFFDGKVPSSGKASVAAIGVTVSKAGQIVADSTFGGTFKPQWWTAFQQTPGYVLNKSDTPFAPLAWDYYEALKPAR